MNVSTSVNDDNKNQCTSLRVLNINEIDISKFINGTDEVKKDIVSLFDKSFHEHGIIRLINTNITSELIDRAKEFFSLDAETKLKYSVDPANNKPFGYKTPGTEAAANYKGEKETSTPDAVELDLSIDESPELFRDVIPEYILKTRQLLSYIHSMADMALELPENTFDEKYTNNDALFALRIAKYSPTKNKEQLGLGEHQDFFGFTLLQNDAVPGLEVNVNGEWFRVEPKPDTLLLVAGELIERWTNNYWISILHRVAAVDQTRYSVLLFSVPYMECVIQTLPCQKCIQQPSKYPPIIVSEHFAQRMQATKLK